MVQHQTVRTVYHRVKLLPQRHNPFLPMLSGGNTHPSQERLVAKSKLLLVDEDRVLLQSLALFLRREGFEVHTCDRAEDVFDQLESHQVEVMLVDLHLPGLVRGTSGGGIDFLREVKRRFPQVVPVVVTGYGSIESAVAATKLGAFDYLTKPVVDDEIRVVVEKAVRHQRLIWENQTLRQQLDLRYGMGQIIGHDPKMLKIYELIGAVADSRTTVLMTGESGTGKSLLARAIHQRSARRDKPFVEVSCGALPESLLESELFGHVKGAFTGAVNDKPGRFLTADGGTLFLDEINSASPAMQVKLLRVLQERQFEPVGSSDTRTVDVRVILATNVDLATLVANGSFRQDLYYRVNVVNLKTPPLRDRPGDIPVLAATFLRRFAKDMNREVVSFSEPALRALTTYPWPGNVRELENAVERAVLLCRGPVIELDDLPEGLIGHPPSRPAPLTLDYPPNTAPMPLEKALEGPERQILLASLERNGWNRQLTSAELGINRTTLYKKMRKYGLDGASYAI